MGIKEDQLKIFAKSGNLTAVINVVQNRANVHVDNDYAFRMSAENGHTKIVKFLIQNGAAIHAGDDYAFRMSASNGHTEIVKFLVQNGANIYADNDSALCFSAEHGHTEIVKFLIQNGAAIHAGDDYALRMSAGNGHTEIVKFLIENGAAIHASNDSALRRSALYGRTEVVKFLVQNGANVRAGNDEALRTSAQRGRTEIVKFLVQNGAAIHADNNFALRMSAALGHTDTVKFLVQNGAHVRADNDYALRMSARKGHTEIVKFLVQNGADVHANNDETLRLSALYGRTEIVKFLVQNGARTDMVKRAFKKILSMVQNNKDTRYYKWQKLCASFGDKSLEKIKSLARLQNINLDGFSKKTEICNALAIKYERKMTRQLTCQNAATILGDDPSLLPRPLLYTVKEGKFNYCFNIIELIKIINLGGTKNPFTTKDLDIADIIRKYEKLKQILVEDKLALVNILDEIKNNRIMDADSILTLHIVSLIALMQHPPSVKDITEMSQQKIRAMISLINGNPLMRIRSSTEIKDFIHECLRILSIDDANQATRKAALEIYFTEVFST